jgi:uncharacterized membrane protein
MADLVVLGLDSPDDAERVLDLARDLAEQQLLQLEDVAYAYRDDKGKIRIHQALSTTGSGAAGGALWGTLIGMLSFVPMAGLAVGAGAGAVAGRLSDVGIDDDTIRQIDSQLEQGKTAVFLLARSATADRVIEAIEPFQPTVIQTTLSHNREDELVQTLQPVGVQEPAPGHDPDQPRRSWRSWSADEDDIRGGDVTRGLPRLDPAEPPPVNAGGPAQAPESQQRHLRARYRDRVRLGQELNVRAWIAAETGDPRASIVLRPFEIPPEGATVELIVYAPAFTVAGPERQPVHVPGSGDSEPVLFALTPTVAGAQKVAIEAWRQGSHLGQLEVEVMVGPDTAAARDREATATVASELYPGEVSLAIRYNKFVKTYVFEFRDEDNPDYVVSDSLIEAPWDQINGLLGRLEELARNDSGSDADVRRELRGQGMRLWRGLVPKQIQEQFWARVDRLRRLTILADDKDPVPWELLYPARRGQGDFGFLVERIPVVRALFNHRRPRQLPRGPASYVLPPNSPKLAKDELEAVRRWLRDSSPLVPVAARDGLRNVLASGQAGLLHFACHNSLSADQGDPKVMFGVEPFTLIELEDIRTTGTLEQEQPLVFLNACRSAGQITLYSQLDGWAQAFLEAGAGAFIGTLWSVRDGAAAQFADVFYGLLAGDGVPFADAVHRARIEVSKRRRDPSWLAYTAYGHPAATITPAS